MMNLRKKVHSHILLIAPVAGGVLALEQVNGLFTMVPSGILLFPQLNQEMVLMVLHNLYYQSLLHHKPLTHTH